MTHCVCVGGGGEGGRVCPCVFLFVSVRVCVHAIRCACVRACVRACVLVSYVDMRGCAYVCLSVNACSCAFVGVRVGVRACVGECVPLSIYLSPTHSVQVGNWHVAQNKELGALQL